MERFKVIGIMIGSIVSVLVLLKAGTWLLMHPQHLAFLLCVTIVLLLSYLASMIGLFYYYDHHYNDYEYIDSPKEYVWEKLKNTFKRKNK